MNDVQQTTVDRLREALAGAIGDVVEAHGQVTLGVAAPAVRDACQLLRDDPDLSYRLLSDLCAVDDLDLGRSPRFRVIYNLYSLTTHQRILLQVRVDEGERIPSVTSVFATADFHEREVYDLFGIPFEGHPDLCRILMPDDWEGHPLRKDYPLGWEPPQFSFSFRDFREPGVERKDPR